MSVCFLKNIVCYDVCLFFHHLNLFRQSIRIRILHRSLWHKCLEKIIIPKVYHFLLLIIIIPLLKCCYVIIVCLYLCVWVKSVQFEKDWENLLCSPLFVLLRKNENDISSVLTTIIKKRISFRIYSVLMQSSSIPSLRILFVRWTKHEMADTLWNTMFMNSMFIH